MTARVRSTNFHHVTYREADALREVVTLAPSGPPINGRFRRLMAARVARTPLSERGGPKCRECGEVLKPRERAIVFRFIPLATAEYDGGLGREAWLHVECCPTERSIG